MKNIKHVKEYFVEYVTTNNIDITSEKFESLLDIIYTETIEHFENYETFYNYFTNEL